MVITNSHTFPYILNPPPQPLSQAWAACALGRPLDRHGNRLKFGTDTEINEYLRFQVSLFQSTSRCTTEIRVIILSYHDIACVSCVQKLTEIIPHLKGWPFHCMFRKKGCMKDIQGKF